MTCCGHRDDEFLVSHSLPASMALWRPMSISWCKVCEKPTLSTLARLWCPKTVSTALSPGRSPQRGLGELSTPGEVLPKILHVKKETLPNFEKLWNLNADEANPSVPGTGWATITLALKNIKKHQDMNRFGEVTTVWTIRHIKTSCHLQDPTETRPLWRWA